MVRTALMAVPLAAVVGSMAAPGCAAAPGRATTNGATPRPGPDAPPTRQPDERRQPVQAEPTLSVYVEGPSPISPESDADGMPDSYRASLVVTNTGDAPAEVGAARIEFQLFRGGQRVACPKGGRSRVVQGPRQLAPGAAHVYEATMHCALSEPGDYEVRAYMRFEARGGARELQRQYVGTYPLRPQ
jgi:hypothetical protein